MTQTVADGVARTTERVAAAAERSGRDPADVRIVAAVKGVDMDRIEAAAEAGIEDFGANLAHDLDAKARAMPHVRWHYLGAIQTNKARYLDSAVLVHGLDRAREAEVLQSRAVRERDVLIEVNVAGEGTKQGVAPDDIPALLDALEAYPLVTPRGFMFVAPQAQNPEDVRWTFAEGRRLGERFGLRELSMGMTDDFEVAVEEGATIVRIGRAIFGQVRRAK
jgi:pyridoxal phosphate enzyme (YggS family)